MENKENIDDLEQNLVAALSKYLTANENLLITKESVCIIPLCVQLRAVLLLKIIKPQSIIDRLTHGKTPKA